MKKIFSLSIFFAMHTILLHAQTNTFPSTGSAGIGTTTPNTSALMEMASTTKGLLIPRMTVAQRNAIASPATGLMIYQTNNTPGFYYYDGGAWQSVSGRAANRSLSNLTGPTALNVNLLPDSNNTFSLGSSSLAWRYVYTGRGYYIGGIKVFDISGIDNTFLGATYNVTNIGNGNTAVGSYALASDSSGSSNTANGSYSLYSNITGSYNVSSGNYSLYSNKGGYFNVAYGHNAMYANVGGSDNTALGTGALYSNTTGNDNSAVGANSLLNNQSGYSNVAVGEHALGSNTIGYQNTATGVDAGAGNTSGHQNTFIGNYSNSSAGDFSNSSAFGNNSIITASNQVRIGNNIVTSIGGYVNWTNISDGRVKKNIKQNVPGLAFINKLKPVTYNLDLNEADKIIQRPVAKDKETRLNDEVGQGKVMSPSSEELTDRVEKEKVLYTGFVAQDVEKAAKELNYDFSGVDAAKNDHDLYGLRYSDFVVPLVKAVQELSKANDDKDAKIDDLQKQIDELKAIMISGNQINGAQTSNIKLPRLNDAVGQETSNNISLEQNTPNPFNSTTVIHYTLPQTYSSAQIIITDKNGKTLKQASLSGNGKGSLNVDASTLASGAYHYSLYVDGKMIGSKQMELIK